MSFLFGMSFILKIVPIRFFFCSNWDTMYFGKLFLSKVMTALITGKLFAVIVIFLLNSVPGFEQLEKICQVNVAHKILKKILQVIS